MTDGLYIGDDFHECGDTVCGHVVRSFPARQDFTTEKPLPHPGRTGRKASGGFCTVQTCERSLADTLVEIARRVLHGQAPVSLSERALYLEQAERVCSRTQQAMVKFGLT